MICTICKTEYDPKRKTSKYCSPSCRKRASRSVTKLSVTKKKEVSVTEEEEELYTECTHSGEHLSKEDWNELREMKSPLNAYAKLCPLNM